MAAAFDQRATTIALASLLLLGGCSSGATAPRSVPITRSSTGSGSPAEPRKSPATPPTEGALPRPFQATSVRLELDPVVSGLSGPIAVTNAGDASGRLFVAEQEGRIVAIDGGTETVSEFLDITSLTVPGGEQGLLGLAFHPGYEDNGRFFVNYTDVDGDTVIAEYIATPYGDRADSNSARVLMRIDQPYVNHNGGQLAFGPDGYLYVGMGDGGSGGDPEEVGQSLESLLGKILRIDVDAKTNGLPYGIPKDNPFVDQTEARQEIWAYGLRNPWRFSFDAETDHIWIADVGQDVLEEVNRAKGTAAGLNYGWDEMEGSACYEPSSGCDESNKVLPITEYSHEFGCAVTGGYVYRGPTQEALVGGYFFGDYCSGTIWAVDAGAAPGTPPVEILKTQAAISSFGEDEAGELYLADLVSGTVYRLVAG